MTNVDILLVSMLSIICNSHQSEEKLIALQILEEVSQHIKPIFINAGILETASQMLINPSDAIRVGAVIEHGIDGIITWEPEHFTSVHRSPCENNSSSTILFPEEKSGNTVLYKFPGETRETYKILQGSHEKMEETASVVVEVFSVNEFLVQFLEQPDEAETPSFDRSFRPRLYSLRYSGEVDPYSENKSSVRVEIQISANKYIDATEESNDGLLHTTMCAINSCLKKAFKLTEFDIILTVPPLPGIDGDGDVLVEIVSADQVFTRRSYQNDFLLAFATAYLDALASLLQCQSPPDLLHNESQSF